jgi:hypothetical protein
MVVVSRYEGHGQLARLSCAACMCHGVFFSAQQAAAQTPSWADDFQAFLKSRGSLRPRVSRGVQADSLLPQPSVAASSGTGPAAMPTKPLQHDMSVQAAVTGPSVDRGVQASPLASGSARAAQALSPTPQSSYGGQSSWSSGRSAVGAVANIQV